MPKIKFQKPSKSEMCPVGYHVVSGHYRVCKSGTRTWVDAHIRKNSKNKKSMYLVENLHNLYWSNQKKYKNIGKIKGYPVHSEIDPIIHFWLDYWSTRFKGIPKFDPLLIKTIIAVESNFNPKADPKVKHSTAYGLMQIVNQARASLRGPHDKSVTKEYITVSREDLEDPVINIAVGTRWLIYKYYVFKKKKGDKIYNTLKGYYNWGKGGDEYATKVLKLYNSSK